MKLNELSNNYEKHASKRLGRGCGSGKGRASGRGHNGQKSRSGHNIPNRFEGGQTSLIQRLPKSRGFRSIHIKPIIIKYNLLQQEFNQGDLVSPKTLFKTGLINSAKLKVKILGPIIGKKTFKFKNCQTTKSIAGVLQKSPL